jgi:DNA polymerase-1
MSETVVLIDGMYLAFSAFYSNRNMRTLEGEPTGAIFGFVNRTENLIKELKPDKIAAAFDVRGKTFRHQLFPEYKAKRLSPPEELLAQLPRIKEYLKVRNISAFECSGFEADDIINELSKKEADQGNKVIIFSADKDLFQLVKDNISIFHPKLKEILNAEGIKENFGIYPEQIVDYLALTGDSSDNIPGVPGIGEKTAKKIVNQFGTIDQLLKNLDEADEKIKSKIQSNLEILKLSKQLIDLSSTPDSNMDYKFQPFIDEINHQLIDLYEKLSFRSLLKKIKDYGPIDKMSGDEDRGNFRIQYHVISKLSQLKELKEKVIREKYFAFDLETTELDFFKSETVGLSISFNTEGYYIPFIYPKSEKVQIDFNLNDFVTEMKDIFESEQIKKSGHNLKFDVLHLKKEGIDVKGIDHDSMIMSYLIYPNRRAHNLKDLTREVLNIRQKEYDELVGKGKNKIDVSEVSIDKISRYCIDDSFLSLQLVNEFKDKIQACHLDKLYKQIEIPLIVVLTDMEFNGFCVDLEFLRKATKRFQERIKEIEKEIFSMAGYSFNLNSSQQLGELLFEKMNLPVKKRTRKTKFFSTDIEVLKELKNFPIVAKIIEFRSHNKILSTYLKGLTDSVDSNKRIHSSFNQTVTATGRLSSSNPNLQNIPVGEIAGINVRDAFISEGDKFLLTADYSQIELRVMAHFSKDKNLIEAFKNEFDIHQHTADRVFGKNLFLSQQEQRKRAKIINFSILYGSGPFSLSKELGVSYTEARDFIDLYFEKYSGVKAYIDKLIANTEKNPEVRTISGRRRDIPEILSSNRNVKENGKRMAINTTIQGSAADIIKIAMIKINEKIKDTRSKLIMQVHDELVFEYVKEEEKSLIKIVKEEMENSIKLNVPLKVTLKRGKTWGTMQSLVD